MTFVLLFHEWRQRFLYFHVKPETENQTKNTAGSNLFCVCFLERTFNSIYLNYYHTAAQTCGFIHVYCCIIHLCTSLRANLNKDVYLWPWSIASSFICQITSILLSVLFWNFSILLTRYKVLGVFWGFCSVSLCLVHHSDLSYLYTPSSHVVCLNPSVILLSH